MKIIFVCHGNICRSVSAEYIAKYLIDQYHIASHFEIISRAVSIEEEGNDIYPPMKMVLLNHHIPTLKHHAKKISSSEYQKADVVFAMDYSNIRNLSHMFNDLSKVKLLGDYLPQKKEIEDPWYTSRYEKVFQEIYQAIDNYLRKICTNHPSLF